MIISNKKVLVLFRTLLIEGLESLSDEDKKIIPTTTKILYENIYHEKNYNIFCGGRRNGCRLSG